MLDDATSAVDPEVEAPHPGRRCAERGGDSTMLLIAYRKATIALADEVLFLDGGRIADRGTHERAARAQPGLRTLVNAYETEGVAT